MSRLLVIAYGTVIKLKRKVFGKKKLLISLALRRDEKKETSGSDMAAGRSPSHKIMVKFLWILPVKA
eukprot:g7427.t1